jgi:hypothetical protein
MEYWGFLKISYAFFHFSIHPFFSIIPSFHRQENTGMLRYWNTGRMGFSV